MHCSIGTYLHLEVNLVLARVGRHAHVALEPHAQAPVIDAVALVRRVGKQRRDEPLSVLQACQAAFCGAECDGIAFDVLGLHERVVLSGYTG